MNRLRGLGPSLMQTETSSKASGAEAKLMDMASTLLTMAESMKATGSTTLFMASVLNITRMVPATEDSLEMESEMEEGACICPMVMSILEKSRIIVLQAKASGPMQMEMSMKELLKET